MWPYPPPAAARFWFPPQAYNTFQDIPNHNPAQPSFDHQVVTHRPAFRHPFIPNRAYPPPPPAPQPRLHYNILPPPAAPISLPTASTMPRGRRALAPSENTNPFHENNSLPTAAPRSPPTPETMPPPKRRRVAAASNSARTLAEIALPPTPENPVEPCTGASCHFHRLRCGHIVKTPLTLMPSLCATNCATNCATTVPPATDDPDYNNGFGIAPFECPVCVARSLNLIWKMDVVNLKKQLPTLSMEDFAKWIHDNYNKAWEQRKRVRLEAWMGPAERRRECLQLAVKERSLVIWNRGETRAPYPIEEFRRVYEKREVSASFWGQQYKDNTIVDDDGEAEPGVVYQSVERPGVHYPAEQQLRR